MSLVVTDIKNKLCFNEINGTRLVTGLDENSFVININSFLAGCKYVYSIFNGLDAKVPGVTLARKIILSCFKAKLVTSLCLSYC